MPTKRNKAGQQQNYVPAGHGDASGEYGDNATGSNIHIQFGEFKKPTISSTSTSSGVEVKGGEQATEKVGNDFDEYLNNTFSNDEQFKNGLKTSFEAGNDEQKEILNYFVSNGIIKLEKGKSSYYNSYFGVTLNQNQFKNQTDYAKEQGDTLYHEFGHAFDNMFAKGWKDKNGNVIFKGLLDEKDKEKLRNISGWARFDLEDNLSSAKILSNGKTLFETLKAEGTKMSRDGRWNAIIEEYKNRVEEATKNLNITDKKEELNNILVNIDKEVDKQAPINWDIIAELGYREKIKNERDTIKQNLLNEQKEKITSLTKEINENVLEKTKIQNKIMQEYASLSDMYGIHKGIAYGFGSGHPANYGKNMKGAMGFEFFAEFNSANARNDASAKRQIELYEKYMPESTKMARELFGLVQEAWKGIKK